MKTKLMIYAGILTFCILGLAIDSVKATGRTFIISPMEEVIDTRILSPPGKVSGNFSVENGTIDFFVTSPSKDVILCFDKTGKADFNFSILENGNYTMHLVNSYSLANLAVQLDYSIKLKVCCQIPIGFASSVGTVSVIAPSPFDWTPIWRIIEAIGYTLLSVFVSKIRDFIDWLKWIRKYRKSRTPVVLVPSS